MIIDGSGTKIYFSTDPIPNGFCIDDFEKIGWKEIKAIKSLSENVLIISEGSGGSTSIVNKKLKQKKNYGFDYRRYNK